MFTPTEQHSFLLKSKKGLSPITIVDGWLFVHESEGAQCYVSYDPTKGHCIPFSEMERLSAANIQTWWGHFGEGSLSGAEIEYLAQFPSIACIQIASNFGGDIWTKGPHLETALEAWSQAFGVQQAQIQPLHPIQVSAKQLLGLQLKQQLECLAKQHLAIAQAGINAGCWRAEQDFAFTGQNSEDVLPGNTATLLEKLQKFACRLQVAGELAHNTLDELSCDLIACNSFDESVYGNVQAVRERICSEAPLTLSATVSRLNALDEVGLEQVALERESWHASGLNSLRLVRKPRTSRVVEKKAQSYWLLNSYIVSLDAQYEKYQLMSPQIAKEAVAIIKSYIDIKDEMKFNATMMDKTPLLFHPPRETDRWLMPEQAEGVLAALRGFTNHLLPNGHAKIDIAQQHEFLKEVKKSVDSNRSVPLLSNHLSRNLDR